MKDKVFIMWYSNKELLSGVYDMGFNKPSRIQGAALPIILGAHGTR